MNTILITGEDKKIKELLMQVLHQAGYAVPEDWDQQNNIIKIVHKDSIQDISSLKDKIIELEDALFQEKKGVLYKSILEAIERPLIEHILERTEGNQLKAARILGINRNTIRAKIKKLGINVEKWKI